MSKEQIEEMALTICKNRMVADEDDVCRKCKSHEDCLYQDIACGLYRSGYRKQSEVAREIFEEIEKRLAMYAHIHRYAKEAYKVTEEYADGSPVEMTSVWDACRLEHNGYDDYETMCRLNDNIGYIANSHILEEIERDIAYFKKKYTEGQT